MTVLAEIPLLAGIVLSWSLAAPPGPANALIAQVSTRRGWAAGVLTGAGAIAGDLLMFGLMGIGVLRAIESFPWVGVLLGAAGAVLMTWFAWEAFASARKDTTEVTSAGGFARNFAAVVTSPFNWVWWLTTGAGLFVELGAWIVVGFFAGLGAWVCAWAALARAGAQRFRAFREWIAYGSAAVLLVFAAIVGTFAIQHAVELLA